VDCPVHDIYLGVGLAKPEKHSEFKFHEFALMRGSAIVKALLFFGILILHWILQFTTWSYAERSAPMRVLWNVLATPLLHVGGSFANQYFWTVATANSVLWAAILTYVVPRLAPRH